MNERATPASGILDRPLPRVMRTERDDSRAPATASWLARAQPALLLSVVLLGALLAWLVLVPLAVLVVSAFKPSGLLRDPGFTLAHVIETYSDPQFWSLVWATLQFATGSTAVALVLGGALAWLVERTDLPAPTLVRALVILPMATPAFLLLAPAARNLDPSLEESALVSGANTGQLVFRIILPLLLPVLAGTAIF